MNNRYFKVTEVDAYTLDDVILCGMQSGCPLVNGMPWSFNFLGIPVSHETDDKYIIIGGGGVHMTHNDMLLIHSDKCTVVPMQEFAREYMGDM